MNEVPYSAPVGSTPPSPPPGPLTFGQILDRTYRLARANCKLFLGIASVPSAAIFLLFAAIMGCMFVMIGPQILHDAAPPSTFPTYQTALLVCLGFLAYPILFATFALYMPAASYAATQADQGVRVTFSDAYRVARRHFWRYLWLLILPALYVIVPLLVIVVLVGLGTLLLHNQANLGTDPTAMFFLIPLAVLLYVGMIVYCILLMLRFAVAFPASVEEGLTAWAALQRSAKLTKKAKGRIFLVLLVVYAVMYAVNLLFILIFVLLAAIGAGVAMLAHVTQGSPAFFILIGLAALGYLLVLVACTMFAYAAYSTTLAVLYHDQRLRKDGQLLAMPATLPTPQPGEAV